jgi:hypothetical protein
MKRILYTILGVFISIPISWLFFTAATGFAVVVVTIVFGVFEEPHPQITRDTFLDWKWGFFVAWALAVIVGAAVGAYAAKMRAAGRMTFGRFLAACCAGYFLVADPKNTSWVLDENAADKKGRE